MLKGRAAPERKDVAQACAQLARLAEQQPALAQAANVQAALIRAAYAAPAPVEQLVLLENEARAKLAGGVPLLRNAALPSNGRYVRDALLRVCEAAKSQGVADAGVLATAIRRGQLDVWELTSSLLQGDSSHIAERVATAEVPVEAALMLLRCTLLPFLEQVATQLTPLREGAAWNHGYCPTCGAWPVLAEQRGLDQTRLLRCGLCATAWPVERVLCAFCGNRNYTQLGYLQVEGEEQKQRAATCDNCHTYVKVRSTISPFSALQLLAEEVALLHLDLIALDKGYSPPT